MGGLLDWGPSKGAGVGTVVRTVMRLIIRGQGRYQTAAMHLRAQLRIDGHNAMMVIVFLEG